MEKEKNMMITDGSNEAKKMEIIIIKHSHIFIHQEKSKYKIIK